jgi:precorrin-6B methylase 2
MQGSSSLAILRQRSTIRPDVENMTTTSPPNIVERLLSDQPSFHMGGEARWDSLPETLEAIRASVRAGDTSIETGAGASTVVFIAAGARHTAVSPDPSEHERIRDYCRQIGLDDTELTTIAGLSEDVLPSTLSRDRTLDAAFIDGAHAFPFPAVDWCYISRALKIGGKLLMDDITITTVAPLFHHMMREPNWQLDGVYDDRAAGFTLLGLPTPGDWPGQVSNARYPDFGFAKLPKRLALETEYRLTEAGRRAAKRSPALRKLYKQIEQTVSKRR